MQIASLYRKRDFYVVVYESRLIQPGEYGKGKTIQHKSSKCFDDYMAARAYFDWLENVGMSPSYEDNQSIHYIYAVPSYTKSLAIAKVGSTTAYKATLLVETPYSTLSKLKKHWDEERKARLE